MDHAADEVHEQAQGIVIDDVRVDAHNFPGEPHDTSVLIDYVHHVAAIVLIGEVLIS